MSPERFPRFLLFASVFSLGILASSDAGVFRRITLGEFLTEHRGRAFEGALAQKQFLPGPEAGTYLTTFTLTGQSLHSGQPARLRIQVLGETGADASIYSTTITPQSLGEGQRVVLFLRPISEDGSLWSLDGFPYVNPVVLKPTGAVVIGDENSMFVRSIRPLDGANGVRDEVVEAARRAGIK